MDQQQTTRTIEAVICIPTFRRPDWLARTLASLKAQETDTAFAVVVVDNDAANPAGAEVARGYLAREQMVHSVFVEENQGNCHAINRAFGEARRQYPQAEFFLMIDDDETAEPGWLGAMTGAARASGADIVGGPVPRTFEAPASSAVRKHPLFQSIDGPSRSLDQIHGTGNCLIRRRVFEGLASPDFDLRYNFLGGGDMDFFTRCRKVGFTFFWCADAIACEFVPKDRTTARFLMTRSVRTGSINYVIDRMQGMTQTKAVVKNMVSLGLSLVRAASLLLRTGSPLVATHPVLMSAGRIYASFGALPEPYKAGNTQEASGTENKQDLPQ